MLFEFIVQRGTMNLTAHCSCKVNDLQIRYVRAILLVAVDENLKKVKLQPLINK